MKNCKRTSMPKLDIFGNKKLVLVHMTNEYRISFLCAVRGGIPCACIARSEKVCRYNILLL